MFVPLQELENLAPGTWYVNVLAVLPAFRGAGLGTKLLGLADDTGRKLGKRGMSVIVSDASLIPEPAGSTRGSATVRPVGAPWSKKTGSMRDASGCC